MKDKINIPTPPRATLPRAERVILDCDDGEDLDMPSVQSTIVSFIQGVYLRGAGRPHLMGGPAMNDIMSQAQLTAILKRAPIGRHPIGLGWTREQVLDLWDLHAKSRRQAINLSVWDKGQTISLSYRAHDNGLRPNIIKRVGAALGLAAVCLIGFAILPSAEAVSNEARHECIHQFG